MEIVQFIFSGHFAFAGANLPVWILFVALAAVLILLAAGPVNRLLHGVKMVSPAELVLLINRRDGVVVDVKIQAAAGHRHLRHRRKRGQRRDSVAPAWV